MWSLQVRNILSYLFLVILFQPPDHGAQNDWTNKSQEKFNETRKSQWDVIVSESEFLFLCTFRKKSLPIFILSKYFRIDFSTLCQTQWVGGFVCFQFHLGVKMQKSQILFPYCYCLTHENKRKEKFGAQKLTIARVICTLRSDLKGTL